MPRNRRRLFIRFAGVCLGITVISVGMICQQAGHQRANRELITAIKGLDAEGTIVALKRGADPNAHNSLDGIPGFMAWLQKWYRRDTRFLGDDYTALTEAVRAHDAESGLRPDDPAKMRIVQVLLAAGANPNESDSSKYPTLVFAGMDCPVEIARLLLDHHAVINAKTPGGMSALMMAALYNNPETVELLLQRGANVNIRTNNGVTALMSASAANNVPVEAILLKCHANISAMDVHGTTALGYAIMRRSKASILFMKQHGAIK